MTTPVLPAIDTIFGIAVFFRQVMRQRLPKEVFRSLVRTIDRGEPLDPTAADVVAATMTVSRVGLRRLRRLAPLRRFAPPGRIPPGPSLK